MINQEPITHWHVFREWREDDGRLYWDSAPFDSEASARYVITQINYVNLERRGILSCSIPIFGDWDGDGPIIYAEECRALTAQHDGPMPDGVEVVDACI